MIASKIERTKSFKNSHARTAAGGLRALSSSWLVDSPGSGDSLIEPILSAGSLLKIELPNRVPPPISPTSTVARTCLGLKRGIQLLSLPAILLVLGCASPLLTPVADGPIELGPEEGLLVVDVHTDFAIPRLLLDRCQLQLIRRGGEFRIVRIQAGSYSLERADVVIRDRKTGVRRRGIWWLKLGWVEGNRFEVKAGHINYPGTLIVERAPEDDRYYARIVNRSATALQQMKEQFPELLQAAPFRYAGQFRDDFLQEYSEAERRLGIVSSTLEP